MRAHPPLTHDQLIHWVPGDSCCDDAWEQAYLDFESPAEERAKFLRRYQTLGVDRWPRDLAVAELFCGRGNGLRTLQHLGFRDIEGVDLSPRLLQQYDGAARLYVGDCRDLQWPDACKDVVIVQGGLHHLPSLPHDLSAVLKEVARVLRPGGRFVLIEPWRTAFLTVAHAITNRRLVRRFYRKGDALARMTERESATYENWLARPQEILALLAAEFSTEKQVISWGKLMYIGRVTVE